MRRPCCDKKGTSKGAWTRQEDQKLIDYIRVHGEGCWNSLTKAAGLDRCGKSCRLRWINYLRPDIKRGNFGPDEEDLIIKLHALLGNRWSLIAGRLPGRTDNEVKNYWNTHLRKKLIKMGVDPNNHKLKSMPQLHYHHEPQQCDCASTNMVFKPKEPINGDNNDIVSDAESCLEGDGLSAASSHDFNLDLNVTFSCKNMENNTVPITSGEVESDENPTLLLFN